MRWDDLFDDLESQLERELSAEELDLQIEEERLRLGRLSVRERLLALGSGTIAVTLVTGERFTARPVAFGRDWFSADVGVERVRQCVIPLGAIAGISLAPGLVGGSLAGVADAGGHPSLSDRLGLAFVLRDLCRRRRAVDLVLASGVAHGTIDRVGRDHVDLAVHDRGEPRREGAVREVRIVPLAALLLVPL